MTDVSQAKNRGRPRLFDEELVLDRAITLFSSAGYSAIGMNDLTRVTGLKVGSIYKAYQSKEHFFAKALQRYIALREKQICASPEQSGRARLAELLHMYVRLSQGQEGLSGCLVVAGISEMPNFSFVGDMLREQISSRRQVIGEWVLQGQRDGSITCTTPPAILADILIALFYGLRVLGKAGSSVSEADTETYMLSVLKILD